MHAKGSAREEEYREMWGTCECVDDGIVKFRARGDEMRYE